MLAQPSLLAKEGGESMVKLYRFVDGEWRLVDLGVPSKIHVYLALGYVVRLL